MTELKIDHKMWERLAKRKTDSEISWALKDIKVTMSLHKDKSPNDPAMLGWNAERDALLTEAGRRCAKEYRMQMQKINEKGIV